MSLPKAIQVIDRPVFTSREIALLRGSSLAATSQTLGRLEREGVLVRATRGLWCIPTDPRFTPLSLVMFLSGEHQAYVSFYSALHLHGMIDPIPQLIYVATTAHTRVRTTPLGVYSFHQIDPRFFDGYHWYRNQQSFLIASPEKALVDCLYLSSRKGRRFGTFPEIDLGGRFSRQRAYEWIRRIGDKKLRKSVLGKLRALGH